MKNALKSTAAPYQASARVVDGKLILSFPHALTPVVWQMDLDQAKSSALEVREGKEKDTFTLFLKTPRGENTEVAPFASRDQAVDALMAVARALETAQGKIRPLTTVNNAGGQTNEKKPGSAGKWVAGILAVLMLLILVTIWSGMRPHDPSQTLNATAAAGDAGAATSGDQNGVPLNADELLNKQ